MPTNKKYKYLLPAVIFAFLSSAASYASALEVKLPGLGDNPTLPQYVVFFFNWGISIAGVLALISFTIGAVGLINPNVEAHSEAKDRMKGALIGLVLTMASFIIIHTINPALETPTLTALPQISTPATPPAPGIYYYLQTGCKGDSSSPNTSSQDQIAPPYNGNIKSFKIINGPAGDPNYGIVFHQVSGLKNGGLCSFPVSTTGCHNVNIAALAADIFTIKYGAASNAKNDAVTFYSAPYGWDAGAHAGYYPVGEKEINPYYPQNVGSIVFNYIGVDRQPGYINVCKSFSDCPGSIKLKNNYLVGLYANGNSKGSYCQTFTADIPNLNTQPFIASGGKIGFIYIYATK